MPGAGMGAAIAAARKAAAEGKIVGEMWERNPETTNWGISSATRQEVEISHRGVVAMNGENTMVGVAGFENVQAERWRKEDHVVGLAVLATLPPEPLPDFLERFEAAPAGS